MNGSPRIGTMNPKGTNRATAFWSARAAAPLLRSPPISKRQSTGRTPRPVGVSDGSWAGRKFRSQKGNSIASLGRGIGLPKRMRLALRRGGVRPGRFVLTVSVAAQTMRLFERVPGQPSPSPFPHYIERRRYLVSTSAYGTGQAAHSQRTPLGLHRIAEKIGTGQPIGTIFRHRRVVGLTWQGQPDAAIVHRILWLEGLEPGFNRGGSVDSYRRYIYIHGFGDESTLGRPASHGCIHVAAHDLMPLFDWVPVGTLVWIEIGDQ